jgi:hypothetical protein
MVLERDGATPFPATRPVISNGRLPQNEHRLKSSRSEIYSRALGEFIGTHAPDRVTERMNDVVRDLGIEPDAFSVAAARKVLKYTEW